jgi:hypothetical protein
VQLAVFFFTRGTTTTINHTKQRSPRFELKTKHPRHRENQLYSVVQAQCLRSCIEPPLGITADFSLAPPFCAELHRQLLSGLPYPPNTSLSASINSISTYSWFLCPDIMHSNRTLYASLAATTAVEQGRGAKRRKSRAVEWE